MAFSPTIPYGTPDIPHILRNVKPKVHVEKIFLCSWDLGRQLVIDGQLEDAATGKTFTVVDPRTEQSIIEVAEGDAEDIDRAVKAARRAFEEGPWPRLSGRVKRRTRPFS